MITITRWAREGTTGHVTSLHVRTRLACIVLTHVWGSIKEEEEAQHKNRRLNIAQIN